MNPSDMWGTPAALADAIVVVLWSRYGLHATTTFTDPSCGNGAFLCALHRFGYKALQGYEINQDLACEAIDATNYTVHVMDCDALTSRWHTDVTLTNPPFSRALEFVAHCREMSPLVALVLPIGCLEPTKSARKAYRNVGAGFYHELRTVYPFPRVAYEPLAGNGTDSNSGKRPDALYVWQRGYTGATEIDYSIARRLMAKAETEHQGALV